LSAVAINTHAAVGSKRYPATVLILKKATQEMAVGEGRRKVQGGSALVLLTIMTTVIMVV